LNSFWYRKQNADVAVSNFDAYEHWLLHGASEGRLPSLDLVDLAKKLITEREQLLQATIKQKQRLLTEVLRDSIEREKSLAEILNQIDLV